MFYLLAYKMVCIWLESAPVAQLAEHNHGKVGVSSSILLGSLFLSLRGGRLWQKKVRLN